MKGRRIPHLGDNGMPLGERVRFFQLSGAVAATGGHRPINRLERVYETPESLEAEPFGSSRIIRASMSPRHCMPLPA